MDEAGPKGKARSYGDLSSWRWNPGLGGLMWLEPLTPEIFLPIFIHHMWVWDQPIMCLHPFYQSRCALLFNSVVVGLPFSSISGGSEWWLFYSLVVILMWFCEEASCVYLHLQFDQKSPWHCSEYLQELMWVTLTTVLRVRCCYDYYSHLKNKEMETQRQVTQLERGGSGIHIQAVCLQSSHT